jgi:6-phosphogluconate dehydrogenase
MIQLGVIGLSTMGANLARNAARNGARVAVYNRTTDKMRDFIAQHGSEGNFVACETLEDLKNALKPPRPILLMVKAGKPVDDVIAEVLPQLEQGDILIDGGNSLYSDTQRREKELAAKGIRFVGMGVSGGEEGALHGPSMMLGGEKDTYDVLRPLLQKMAAKDGSAGSSGGRCIGYMGPGGAGHFVKMVHNGIEYGDMQLIAEAYYLLSYGCGLTNEELANTFAEWNKGEDLQSFLIEITAQIFRKKDEETGKHLVDLIVDKAGQKGTGKWTTQAALDLGIAIPTITAAVDARIISSLKDERMKASDMMDGFMVTSPHVHPDHIRDALFLSKICSYAQGFTLLKKASEEYGWKVPMQEVCRIWTGGCIIRSTLLATFEKAFAKNPDLPNLLIDPTIHGYFREKLKMLREVVAVSVSAGMPVPAMSASLAYFDSYFHDRLPQNLIQAQRDFFGAHTFERTDKQGTFHADWSSEGARS